MRLARGQRVIGTGRTAVSANKRQTVLSRSSAGNDGTDPTMSIVRSCRPHVRCAVGGANGALASDTRSCMQDASLLHAHARGVFGIEAHRMMSVLGLAVETDKSGGDGS
jgi:hypothetical protein